MQSIRERILEIIQRNRASSVPELSRILGVSKPAVQYHIQKLTAEGFIQQETTAPPAGMRGRPTKRYQTAENRQPENYAVLAESMLTLFFSKTDVSKEPFQPIKMLSHHLAGATTPRKPFIKRMEHCLARLNQMNYQPHWEVHSTGSRIHLRNCPYAQIVATHPELCEMDHILLCDMLGVAVQQESVWGGRPGPNPGCFFFFTR